MKQIIDYLYYFRVESSLGSKHGLNIGIEIWLFYWKLNIVYDADMRFACINIGPISLWVHI